MKTSTFENGTTTLTCVGRALLAALAALAIGAAGCDGGREGDYCVIALSHNDCNSGLVCTVVQWTDPAGIRTFSCGESHCCPATGTSNDPYCNGTNEAPTLDDGGNVLSSVCPLVMEAGPPDAAPEGGGDDSMSDAPMMSDAPTSDAPTPDATMTDGPSSTDAPASSDAPSEASSSPDASSDAPSDVVSDVKAQ
jgi:hypothetical protein